LNLALALIGQRVATQEAAGYLKGMLLKERQNWSKMEEGIFSAIVNKPAKKGEDSLDSPEIEDQLLRLDLLNLLAILRTPKIEEAIREYLSDRSWEVSAEASLLLLTEGDESSIDIVRRLMLDDQPRIRLLAALILSLWSREESAIQVLEEGYRNSDWTLKARILESIGRIGSVQSIPFLMNVLKEPSQSLRLIAAMALIQCLNH
jgi:HEAT repeat protein